MPHETFEINAIKIESERKHTMNRNALEAALNAAGISETTKSSILAAATGDSTSTISVIAAAEQRARDIEIIQALRTAQRWGVQLRASGVTPIFEIDSQLETIAERRRLSATDRIAFKVALIRGGLVK